MEASVVLDFSKQPRFTGGLALEAKGFSTTREHLFSLTMEVTVDPRTERHEGDGISTVTEGQQGITPRPVPMVPIASDEGEEADGQ